MSGVVVRVGKEQTPSSTEKEATEPRAQFDDRDDQVLRYIAGFIPYTLLKRYRKCKTTIAKEYSALSLNCKAKEDKDTQAPSFLSYTIAWVEMQNSGGLFTVSDEVFRFFRALEKVSKPFLQKKSLSTL